MSDRGAGVVVGIPVHAEPERLRATLEAVRRTAPPGAGIVVIPDRPDAETSAALREMPAGAVLPQPDAPGGAAAFNQLMRCTDAALGVLLESGCIPGPRWLHHLLAALAGDPRNGLAGPSTNRSWNEQGCEPACGSSGAAIDAAALRLEARHGGSTRTLEPLYSLADFCYAVRRDVWADIGAADEGYGAGPCWEMEYNARGARAGWRGVWAPAAFVWRAPFTARRALDERRLFEASRRRYQDRLCGLRLSGATSAYQPHCRGDACEHFAPGALVQLRIDPAPASPPPARPVVVPAPHAAPRARPAPAAPMVSCIMPTGGRPELALQAVRYFQAQDYPHRELIVLDDAGGDLARRLPADDRIRYVQLGARETIGAKRNRGVELARGELVAQWDDDDWYAPQRLRVQAAPILAGEADVTALRCDVFFDLERWEFWSCTDALHRRLFVHDVHGGTLMYRRSVWGAGAAYPAASLAEDAAFLSQAVRRGARLRRVEAAGVFAYVRHGANAWRFACGRHVDPSGWRRIAEPAALHADREFYRRRTSAAPPPGSAPLVSCLMPTADRPRFVARSVEYFLRQSYPNRELLVVDDGREPVEALLPEDPRIRYARIDPGLTLGAKRDLGCDLARGELVAHWDDDDWAAADRLTRQVAALQSSGAEACGLSVVRYFDPARSLAWEYRWPDPARPWVGGNTLLYHRALWERHRFPNVGEGEDTRWMWGLPSPLLMLREPTGFAALIHPANTSAKHTGGSNWHPLPLRVVSEEIGVDWPFYEALRDPAAVQPPSPPAALAR